MNTTKGGIHNSPGKSKAVAEPHKPTQGAEDEDVPLLV